MNYAWKIFMDLMAVVGCVASVWTIIVPAWRKFYTWKEIDQFAFQLANQIKTDGINPSLVCGIGRGGGILGALISYRLGTVPFIVIDRIYKYENGLKSAAVILKEIELKSEFNKFKEGPIILVTPQSDPGITLGPCRAFLEANGFQNIKKCVILRSAKSLDGDIAYQVKTYERSAEIKSFPWSRDMVDVMEKKVHNSSQDSLMLKT
jgi:hypoxanthine phosphoribosyltransferase